MDWSEEDQKVAGGHSEGLEGPTSETPLKDTGLPPSPPSPPPIDGRTLSDQEAWTRWLRSMDTLAQGHGRRLGPVALPQIDKEERKEALEAFRKAEYMKQYNARPEVKAKMAEYMKQYNARPEVKAKMARYM